MKKQSMFGAIVGSFGGLCCAGAPFIIAALTSLGVGFIINDFIVIPLFLVGAGWMLFSLKHNQKHHKNKKPLIIATLGVIITAIGIFVTSIIWGGIILMLAGSIMDMVTMKRK